MPFSGTQVMFTKMRACPMPGEVGGSSTAIGAGITALPVSSSMRAGNPAPPSHSGFPSC